MLVVGERSISADEVDEWLPAIDLIEPGRSLAGKRRLALTNVVLHRAIAAQIDPERYQKAREQADALRAKLVAGEELPADGPQVETIVEGYWHELGIDAWQEARTAPLGEWSEVRESTAYFYIQRVNGRDPEPWTKEEGAAVDRVIVPYIDEAGSVDVITEAEKSMQLVVVDSEWDELLPAHYKYRMGVTPTSERETPAEPAQ